VVVVLVTAGGNQGSELGAVARCVFEQCGRGQVGVDGFGCLGEELFGSGEDGSLVSRLLAVDDGVPPLCRAASHGVGQVSWIQVVRPVVVSRIPQSVVRARMMSSPCGRSRLGAGSVQGPPSSSTSIQGPRPATPLPHARLHDLRHIHVTTLLLAGTPVHVVAARLGHVDPAITLRVYAHVIRSAEAAAAIFGQAVDLASSEPAPSPDDAGVSKSVSKEDPRTGRWRLTWEPPIGIEPMTYALRVRRSSD
jgi:hypothetical protein